MSPNKLLASIVLLISSVLVYAQESIPGRKIICPADPNHSDHFVPPPKSYQERLVNGRSNISGGANFEVNYIGFSNEAQAAFQKAVDIWSSILKSDVTIRIQANWTPLATGVLGSAGPTQFYRDFENTPYKNTWYAVALAEKLAGKDLNAPNEPDITASFSSSFDWYLGTDGQPGNKYDLVTVVLHEIGHGLGFAAYGAGNGDGIGYWDLSGGFAGMYSPFIVDGNGASLLDMEDGSTALATYFTSNNLFLNNELAVKSNSGTPPKIYAPRTYSGGSSISHWDDATFDGTINALMTHAVGAGEAVLDPGPNTLSVFAEMGWFTSGYRHKPVSLIEATKPLVISTKIFSDTSIVSSDLKVKYFYEGTQDTLSVSMVLAGDTYSATINLDGHHSILKYYIEGLSDGFNRSYTSPIDISESLYSVTILGAFQQLNTPYALTDGGDFESNAAHFSSLSSNSNYRLWERGDATADFSGLNTTTAWKTKIGGDIGKPSLPTSNILLSQPIDLSDTTMDYVVAFDYLMDVASDGELTLLSTIDTTSTFESLDALNTGLGTNWYDIETASFSSSTLDEGGNFKIVSVEFPLYELAGKKPMIGFDFRLGGDKADTVYEVQGVLIDNFEVKASTPKARFYSLESGKSLFPGSEVSFYFASNGASSYLWEFGDGETSIEKHPKHIYAIGGKFSVKLTIQYPSGSDSQTLTEYISVIENKGANYTLADGGNFETDNGDFTAENIAGTRLSRGKSTITGKDGTNSGDFAWVFGLNDAEYTDDSEAYLYTSVFDFSLVGKYTLSFFAKYSFEDEWDGFILEYSIDQGVTWEKLDDNVRGDWYDMLSDPDAVFGPNTPIFSGNTNGVFVQKKSDVSFLGGQSSNVAFRFTILTDAAVVDAGVALDDFTLTGPVVGPVSAALISSKISGTGGCENQVISFSADASGSISGISWDFGAGATPETATGLGPHEVTFLEGTNLVKMTVIGVDQSVIIEDTTVVSSEAHIASISAVNNFDGSFTLTASDGDSYQWLLDKEPIEGATSQTLITFENGEYSVEIYRGTCLGTISFQRLRVAGLLPADDNIKLFPNPVIGLTKLANSGKYESASVRVIDLSGKEVIWQQVEHIKEDLEIDLAVVNKGIYLIEVVFDNKYFYRSKVIKD